MRARFTAGPVLVSNEVPLKSLEFPPWAKQHPAADSWLSCRLGSLALTDAVAAADSWLSCRLGSLALTDAVELADRHESQESAAE